MKKKKYDKKVILCILDGWGLGPDSESNAVFLSKKKNFDSIISKFSFTSLQASENEVGLPKGQFGNSEVGHMTIGSGRIIQQDVLRITDAISSGDLAQNEELCLLKTNCERIHLMGLLSSGGVHGHEDHLFSLIDILSTKKNKIFLHCILDGRDSPPNSGLKSMEKLVRKLKNNKKVKIASVIGRYYSMDRDNRWDRIELAYKAIVEGSMKRKSDPIKAIQKSYENFLTDEFFYPTNIGNYDGFQDNDGFLITNYRTDRVREILTSIFDKNFNFFKRSKIAKLQKALGMVEYSRTLKKYLQSIFKPLIIKNTLGEVISKAGFSQLRIAETEKYAHVTYFFNGGNEEEFKNEKRILIPSPRVRTYDQKPQMSSEQLTEKLIIEIQKQTNDFILVNYANPDMVGHTGVMSATIKAIEAVDICIGRLFKVAIENEYILILTSDHGNADMMIDLNELPCTTHTINPVPFIICDKKYSIIKSGSLPDIAPTVLKIMGIKSVCEINGKSLI